MRQNRAGEHALMPFHLSFDWDATREKMKKACTQEKLAVASLVGATLAVFGALLYSLMHAVQNFTIVGY